VNDTPELRKGFIRARPMRVAYLVEESEHAHTILDAVFAECHSRWGGRFSLIVPARAGDPDPLYAQWLDVYDPDVLYVYTELEGPAVARLRERYGPAFVLRHDPHDSGERDTRYYRPELPFPMLSSLSVALQYARAYAPSTPQPMLVPDRLPGVASDRFIDDNFGTPSDSFHRWPLPENLADVVKPITLGTPEHLAQFYRGGPPMELVSDASALLRAMAQRRNSFGLAQLAADSAPRMEIPGGESESFSLVIGDGFADRILFWNERSLMPSYLGRGFVTFIVSPARLEDPGFFESFVAFLKTRNAVHGGGSRNPWVKIRSSSLERQRLEEFRTRLQAVDGWNSYHVADPVTPNRMVPSEQALHEAGGLVLLRGFDREPSWKDFPIHGTTVRPPPLAPAHLTAVHGRSAATEGLWGLDLDIERRNNLSRYSNVTHRWRLPGRLHMHGAFRRAWSPDGVGVGIRYSRSSRDGFLVLYSGIGEDPPDVTIPDDEEAFRYALVRGDDWPPISRRDNVASPHGPYAWTRPSDKGRYLGGTLRLFGGLQTAAAYLLHAYWKSVVEDLGGATGAARHDEIKRILRRRLRDTRLQSDESWDRLARLVAAEAHRVRMPLRKLSFDEFRSRHAPFVEKERNRLHNSTAPDITERIKSAEASLSISVQALCARSVLYQGYEWRCDTCFHTNWNPIGSLRSAPSCEVCGEVQPAPVDRPWDFRLNGFVREALKEHGVLALVWCLAQMEARVQESFFFLGPHELYSQYPRDAQTASYREADLLCVVDRKVHLCEVKSSDRDVDLESLVNIAKRLRPDVVTLAVMDDASPRLSSRFQELQRELAGTGLECELLTRAAHAFENDAFLPT
jgi:hypothetical protein